MVLARLPDIRHLLQAVIQSYRRCFAASNTSARHVHMRLRHACAGLDCLLEASVLLRVSVIIYKEHLQIQSCCVLVYEALFLPKIAHLMQAPGAIFVLALQAESAGDSAIVSCNTTIAGHKVPMANTVSHSRDYEQTNHIPQTECVLSAPRAWQHFIILYGSECTFF